MGLDAAGQANIGCTLHAEVRRLVHSNWRSVSGNLPDSGW